LKSITLFQGLVLFWGHEAPARPYGSGLFYFEEDFLMKKFFYGMAVLLSVSLFVIGCAQEPEETIIRENTEVMIDIDRYVSNATALADALKDSSVKKVGFLATGGEETLSATDEDGAAVPFVIPNDRTVVFFSDVAASAQGLVIEGIVYVSGGTLTAAATAKISVEDQGRLYVQSEGTLVTDVEASVDNGTAGTTALGTAAVGFTGTLSYSAATDFTAGADAAADQAAVAKAVGYAGSGTLGISDAITKLTPENLLAAAAGKPAKFAAEAGAAVAAATTTLEIPSNVYITALSSDALATVKTLTVKSGGGFSAAAGALVTATAITVEEDAHLTSIATGLPAGVKIVVGKGAGVTTGTLAKVAAGSSVAGDLTAIIAAFVDADAKLTVVAGAKVNGLTFPAATEISSALAADTVTIDNLSLNGEKTLTVPAGKTLGVNATKTITVSDGTLVLTAAASTGGAKLAGTGKVIAGAAEIVGGTAGWQAVGASGTVSITADTIASSVVAAELTAQDAASAITVAAAGTLTVNGVITLAASKGKVVLTGSTTTAGALLLKGGTNPGTLVVDAASTTAEVTIGTLTNSLTDGSATATTIASVTKDGTAVAAGIVVKAAADATASLLGSIAGGTTASTNDAFIKGPATAVNSEIATGWKYAFTNP
jgi:hypothetical protein